MCQIEANKYETEKFDFLLPEISQVGLTKIAINFFKLNQLTSKMSQIEANTCGYEFWLSLWAKIGF